MNSSKVFVCQSQSCLTKGSAEVLATFLSQAPSDVTVIGTGCQGQCHLGATVRILPDEIWYCRVKPEHVRAIVQQHLASGQPVQTLLHPRFHPSF